MAALKRNGCVSVASGDEGWDDPAHGPKRRATVFDATAGRISQAGFIPEKPVPLSKHREFVSAATAPARPDEVLFRQRNAPPRYAESDFYFAHAQLHETGRTLPPPELVKALHGYIAHHFERSGVAPRSSVWKSLDETGLLALAVLVEETARGVLGDTGDFAFVEPGEAGTTASKEAVQVPSVVD